MTPRGGLLVLEGSSAETETARGAARWLDARSVSSMTESPVHVMSADIADWKGPTVATHLLLSDLDLVTALFDGGVIVYLASSLVRRPYDRPSRR